MIRSVSIVGAGIGSEHLAGYTELPDRFHVANVCDLDAERGQALVSQYDGVELVTELDTVLADPSIDIVDICLPPHLHFEACLAALNAGKTVVCEKPLVSSLSEADRLIEATKSNKGTIYPVFQYRYGLGTSQLNALIHAGLAGKCFAGTLETHWDRDADYYSVDWRGTWAGEQGGAILGHAIHIHDLLGSILGPVRQVFADLATRVNNIEVEDCAALSFRMENGALITSSVTLGAAENTSRLKLMFEGFTVESDHAPYSLAEKAWRFTARTPVTQSQIDEVLTTVAPAQSKFAGLFEAMADAMDGNPGREVTLQDGRRSLELVTAVYASARSGLPTKLPMEKDHPLYNGWVP